MRMAKLVKSLQKFGDWVMVCAFMTLLYYIYDMTVRFFVMVTIIIYQILPPWGPLPHWKSKNVGAQSKVPWKLFFDVSSLHKYIPVMELEDYISSAGRLNIFHF